MTEKKTDDVDWGWFMLFVLIIVQWFVMLFFILPSYAWEWQADSNERRIEYLEKARWEHHKRLLDVEWGDR